MRAWLENEAGEHAVKAPYHGAPVAESTDACPCGSAFVKGNRMQRDGHDTYRASAFCAKCDAPRGVLRAQADTLFGLEEDERVLNGRARVY